MPEATNAKQRFYQNLVDIGCEEDIIQKCMLLNNEHRMKELLMMLQKQRKKLLDNVHAGQQQVDCLDYLVNQIEKKQKVYETKQGGNNDEYEIQL